MPILDCSVSTCYYNKQNQCCLGDIKVEGESATNSERTACNSFRERGEDTYSNTCGCGIEPETVIQVDCDAIKCVYNEDRKCKADHIGIAGAGAKHYTETECSSFKPE
ncbi:MAG: DUF1540 domain-containing protein [Eubacterium sp.]